MTERATLVILGATGDLTKRLLLPALGQLLTTEPHRSIRLVGAGMEEWDDAAWQDVVRGAFATNGCDEALTRVESEYRRADITVGADLTALLDGLSAPLALYFAVPPAVAAASCEALVDVGVPAGTMLALEKPFGTDEASARALNVTLTQIVPEEQVFRVDHFLGRATLLNLLGVRFANRVLEPLWSATDVESIDIVYDEMLGLEGRAGYYDKAGALVDMIQSHLLQVLAVVALEEPATLNEIDFRSATAAVLRATRVWGDDPAVASRRARYTAGTIDGKALPAYVDEDGVDPSRETETLAQATFEVHNARWAGVPFRLRSGKALAERTREIVVRFKPVRHVPDGLTGAAPGAVLRFSLGPDIVTLELNVNGSGDPFELERTVLSTDLGADSKLAYTEVLSGVLDGDPLLSVRGDAAEQCWRIVQPVIDAWRRDEVTIDDYAAGSTGPASWA